MTKDDKLVRETILAELKRRRALVGKDEERSGSADDRPVRPLYPPPTAAGTTSE